MSMRVLQLGVGSVGEVTARTVAAVPEVEAVVLADLDAARPRAVAGKLPPGKAELLELDVHDKEALVKALAGVDLVINGLIPEVNLDVMAACLEAGTHYLDMAAAGPRDVVGTADVDEELALHDAFKRAGLTGARLLRHRPRRQRRLRAHPLRPVRHRRAAHGPRRRRLQRRRRRLRAELLADDHGRGMPDPAAARIRGRQERPPRRRSRRSSTFTFPDPVGPLPSGTSTTRSRS